MHKHQKRSLDKETWEGNSRIVSYTKRDEPSRTSTVCTTGADSGTQFVLVKPDMGLPRIGCPRNQSLCQLHYFFAHTAVIAYRKFKGISWHISHFQTKPYADECCEKKHVFFSLENSDQVFTVMSGLGLHQLTLILKLLPFSQKVLALCSTLENHIPFS